MKALPSDSKKSLPEIRENPCPAMLQEGVDHARLQAKKEALREASSRFLGYPTNLDVDYMELVEFFEFSLNNIGDPFQQSHTELQTLELEREVVEAFAWMAEGKPDECWGYVTSGGTEGNMYGLYLARELHPEGIVYFSEETHYSVAKVLRLQHTSNIMLKALPNGEMDYDDLRESIKINRHRPPIIFVNIGTTMKGAIDDLDQIKAVLKDLAIPQSYIHADAALHGLGLAFIDNPPPWNFAAGVDSLSISGHKWLGSPMPCGIALARRKHVDRISRAVEYVGMNDTTITGSRSGLAPLVMWYALRKHGEEGLRTMVRKCIEVAEYAVQRFHDQGVQAWRNTNSPIVVFPRPSKELIRRWALAPCDDIVHIVCLGHVTPKTIDDFVEEYCQDMKKGGDRK